MGFTEQPHPMIDEIDKGKAGGHGRLPDSPERRGINNVNNKFYSNKRIATAIAVSIATFILVFLISDPDLYLFGDLDGDLDDKHFPFAIFAAFLVLVTLIPKIFRILLQAMWQFILDRIRELGKAIRGEE